MKVSGFTFIRDGVRLGYPFEESIRSALPLCDEFIVAIADTGDGTLERLNNMDEPRLRIIQTTWNEKVRKHGFVYAQQKMIAQYNCTGDWALYLESDEIFHEDDLGKIREMMETCLERPEVEALAFDYYHFWGDAGTLRVSAKAYRKAVRVIRNSLRTIAPDGLYWAVIKDKTWLGKRNKRRTRYPRAVAVGVPIFHYGNARHGDYLIRKADTVNQYWENNNWPDNYGNIDPEALGDFQGRHPEIIKQWLEQHSNPRLVLNPDYRPTFSDRKHRLLSRLERRFGLDLSKRHFKLIR